MVFTNIFRTLLIFILLYTLPYVYGQNFYVSPTGTDSPTSGTLNSPWKTINYAAKNANVVPGSTVYILGGTYKERIVLKVSGSSAGYITFAPYQNANVIIDGAELAVNTIPLFNLGNNSYIRISGLKFQNAGVGVQASGKSIEIENNQFNNFTNPAIRVFECSFSKINNNIVDAACTTSWGECITLSGCEYVDVSNNIVRNGTTNTNGGEGIDVKGSKQIRVFGNKVYNLPAKLGIYVDAFESFDANIQVFNNEVYNCTSGIVISSERGNDMLNVRVYNNIVYDLISGNGISIVDFSDTGYLVENVIIENNTLIGRGVSIDAIGGNSIIVRNNIIYDDSTPINIVNRPAGLVLQNNLGNKGTLSALGTNSKIAEPLFINPTTVPKNFNLQASSPAINSGFTNNLEFDYNLKLRAIGVIDIGAYEYNATNTYTISANDAKPAFTTSVSKVVTGGYAIEQKGGSVTVNVKPIIDSINGKIAAIRFNNVQIPQAAKILNAYLKFYNFVSNFEEFNCVQITAENSSNSPTLNNTAFSNSSKAKTTREAIWNPFTTNSADTIMSPGVDYIINEIVSKSTWVSGNAITFLFNYYVLPKKFPDGYAINPYMTFDAYLTSKAKGAELVVEYENKSTATINGNIRNENTIAFVRKDLNTLFVKIETPFRAEVKLVNSLGHTIKSKMSSGNEEYIQFDIRGLRSGIYFVGIKNKNSLSYRKILL
jgi:hypothetical protein